MVGDRIGLIKAAFDEPIATAEGSEPGGAWHRHPLHFGARSRAPQNLPNVVANRLRQTVQTGRRTAFRLGQEIKQRDRRFGALGHGRRG
jgi:hypothetical protein